MAFSVRKDHCWWSSFGAKYNTSWCYAEEEAGKARKQHGAKWLKWGIAGEQLDPASANHSGTWLEQSSE